MEELLHQQKTALKRQISELQEQLGQLESYAPDNTEGADFTASRSIASSYKQEESFFQMLFNSANSSVFLLDSQSRVISANLEALDFFGVSLDKLRGENVLDVFKFFSINTIPLEDVFAGREEEVSYRSWAIHPDREEAVCQLILRRSSSQGKPLFICICTERAAIEDLDEIVRHSLTRLQEALRSAKTFAITIDKHKIITYCNDFLLKITGWKPKDLLGQSLLTVFTPFTASKEFVKVKGFLDTFEGTLHTNDDEELVVRFNSIVMNDSKGDLAVMTIVGEDVTEQVKMSQALQETSARLQEVFDTTSDLILIFNTKGELLYINNASKQTLGYTEEELMDMKVRDFINPDYYEDTYEKLRTAIDQGEYKSFETVFISKNGQKVHLLGDVVCVQDKDSSKPGTIRAILHNYTDQIKAKNSEKLYYSLARLVEKDTPLQELYEQIHLALKQVMTIDSLVIAVHEEPQKPLQVSYYESSKYATEERIQAFELVKYGMSLKKPTMLVEYEILKLIDDEMLSRMVNIPKVWLAVPLILKQQAVGIMIVQSFKYVQDHSEKDLELLSFISGQLTSAIVREYNEAKIYRQAARLGAIFDSGYHLIWTINRRGQLTQFNKHFAESIWSHYQVSAREGVIFRNFYAPAPNKGIDFWLRKYKDAFKGQIQQFPVSFVGENGVERWYEISLNPIFAPDGNVAEVSGVANDITQKKIIELDLSQSEEKFRTIFESFQDVYFRTDMAGVINMVSPSVFDLMGEAQSDVMGKSVTEYYLSQSKLQYLRKMLIAEGSVKNFESTLIDKNSQTKIIISNFRLIHNAEGMPAFIEGVARDITELKSATEELRKAKNLAERSLEVKKRFLSNMSHEIRTPMNGIIGMIDLLSGSSLDAEQMHYVNTVKKSSETLLNILNDILDLSKIEAGKMRIRIAPTALHKTIDKLQALFSQRANAKGTRLVCELSPNLPEFIMTDETRLLQILSNLTSNAIKFTENGTVTLKASYDSLEVDSANYMLRFDVVDTGIGISQENLELLFKQFSQVDNSYTRAHGGTGLGLAISQELSRIMGGQIGVESQIKKGSVFWFTIQTRTCTPEEAIHAKRMNQPVVVQPLKRAHRILVVDDNIVNLQVAQGILGKARCEVTTAVSGYQALEILKNNQFEMIMMDIQMPQMNGMTATEEAKKMLGEACPPVIAMTAFSLQEEREEFLEAGMDDFIPKPINAQELISVVQKWLEPEGYSPKKEDLIVDESTVEPALFLEFQFSDAIINIDTANQLGKYGGKEIISSVYHDFEKETSRLIAEGKSALEEQRWKDLLGVLHTIKGSASTLGVEQVADLSEFIEANIKKEVLDIAPKYFSKLEGSFERFVDSYQELLGLN